MSQEKDSSSRWQFAQNFATEFTASYTDLESRIKSVEPSSDTDIIQSLAAEVASLSKWLSDAIGLLPSYDQRQHEQQVKALEKSIEQLRASKPKSKFAFKRKAVAALSTSSQKKAEPASEASQAATPSSNIVLSSHENTYLGWHSLPDCTDANPSDMTICDLANCVVDLTTLATSQNDSPANSPKVSHITALHIQNLSNCLLLLPNIAGSVLLHDLHRCTIVVGCHQFRMHRSQDVDVFVSISSSPIIEGCERVRFAPHQHEAEEYDSSQKPLNVQDFSHIRPTPSPHWSFLSESHPLPSIKVMGGSVDTKQVAEVLRDLLPPSRSSLE